MSEEALRRANEQLRELRRAIGKLHDVAFPHLSEGQAPEPVAQEPDSLLARLRQLLWERAIWLHPPTARGGCDVCLQEWPEGPEQHAATCIFSECDRPAGMDAARAKAIEADAARYRAIRPFEAPDEHQDRYVVIHLNGKRTTFYNGEALDAAADSLATKGAGS